jgi:hypothetical protein
MTVELVTNDVFAVFSNGLTPGPAYQVLGPYRRVKHGAKAIWGYTGPLGMDAVRIATRPIVSNLSWEIDNADGRQWGDVSFLSPPPGTAAQQIEAALTQGALCMETSYNPADIVPPGLTPEAWAVIRAEVAREVAKKVEGFLAQQMGVMQSHVSEAVEGGVDRLLTEVKDRIDEKLDEGEEWKRGRDKEDEAVE